MFRDIEFIAPGGWLFAIYRTGGLLMRVKRGFKARRRRKKILKLAKGYRGGRSKLYRTAADAVDKALQYAYRDR